jgi:hypothetical protein
MPKAWSLFFERLSKARGKDLSMGAMKQFGPWEVVCRLKDGARLERLRYDGVDLLTSAPVRFRPADGRYGRYESRPVFGYDDCFPTVGECGGWPDHGELCWLAWNGSETHCSVRSRQAPLTFTRRLEFGPRQLLWSFSAINHGGVALPVQHVMHPLMPPDRIVAMELPQCASQDTAILARELIQSPEGSFKLAVLNGIRAGRFRLRFQNGLRLTVAFSRKQFPTLGIWWNNGGYPSSGLERRECAFEPIPGISSRLTEGTTMRLAPHGRLDWEVRWEIQPGDETPAKKVAVGRRRGTRT